MTDEEALRAAVLACPDDDTPRLVYADWCDDAGDADRAAFIRAQVEAARAEPWCPAARDAEGRANHILDAHAGEWTAHLGEALPESWYGFDRGFIGSVGLPALDLRADLARTCAAEPVSRIQVFRGLADVELAPVDSALAASALAQLAALDLRFANLTASVEFDWLAECEHLAGLTELSLAQLRVPPDWLTRFLPGPHLPALTALDVSDIPNLGPALAKGLADAIHRRFTKLNLSGVRFLSREIQSVLSAPAVSEVEEFHLGWSYPGPGPLTMLDLGWVLPLSRLRLLDFAGQQLGPDGVREIVRKPEAAGLRWLGLARNGLGAGGVTVLVSSPHLRLYHLDVSDNGLVPRDLAALRARFPEAVVVG